MLYQCNNMVFVYANNKYYRLKKDRDSLVPTKHFKYSLDVCGEISYDDALKLLSKKPETKKSNKKNNK